MAQAQVEQVLSRFSGIIPFVTSLKAESEKYRKEHPKRNVAMVGLRDEGGLVLLSRTAELPQSWHAIGAGLTPKTKRLKRP